MTLMPGLEHLFVRRLLVEERSRPVDGHALLLADRAELVDRLADHVDDAAQRLFAHGNADGPAEVDDLHAADHAVGGFHRDRAHAAFAQVLLHLENHADGRGDGEAVAGDAQRLIDGRHGCFFKLHVDCRTRNLNDFADVFCHEIQLLASSLSFQPFLVAPSSALPFRLYFRMES